jgi:hypothetical protein
MIDGICLGSIMFDCGDAEQLRNFYASLLGWEKCTLYSLPAIKSRDSIVFLFSPAADYIPPVWPEQDGKQQKQMHLDFGVPDVAAAVKMAEAHGAVKSRTQYGSGDDFVTMLDPARHPFCLCKAD